jgi:hypothetical protein
VEDETDYAACFRNAVNFLVSYMYEINFCSLVYNCEDADESALEVSGKSYKFSSSPVADILK